MFGDKLFCGMTQAEIQIEVEDELDGGTKIPASDETDRAGAVRIGWLPRKSGDGTRGSDAVDSGGVRVHSGKHHLRGR